MLPSWQTNAAHTGPFAGALPLCQEATGEVEEEESARVVRLDMVNVTAVHAHVVDDCATPRSSCLVLYPPPAKTKAFPKKAWVMRLDMADAQLCMHMFLMISPPHSSCFMLYLSPLPPTKQKQVPLMHERLLVDKGEDTALLEETM